MAVIEYFYSAHSAFAYLGSARLAEIAAAAQATVIHRPFLLSPALEAQGSLPFAARTQGHVDYFFGREIERWAEWRGVEIIKHRPTHHDADYSLASGMILALGDRGAAVDAMAHALLQAHWRDDIDLSDPVALGAVASSLGHDAQNLIAQASSNEMRAQLTANTAAAKALPVFGSPTYVVDGDPFYGQDRLEFVERALRAPFAPSTWRNPAVAAQGD
jgi:2-hydroxychromene-2-carboxylate isomerase